MKRRRCILPRNGLLLGFTLLAAPGFPQEARRPLVIGETAVVESRVLDESREVLVAVPPSLGREGQRLGVVYVLDGESQFQHTAATAAFLGGFASQRIPPLLVVGISNTDRIRDLTPPAGTTENTFLNQGGADRLLGFIVDELKPWVEARYPTSDYRVLIGHSLGGLFAAYTLVTRPDAFDSYLLVDPSLNWNGRALLEQAEVQRNALAAPGAAVYLSVSDDQGPEFDAVRRLAELLDLQIPGRLRWTLEPIADESHDSIPLPAVYRGLQWIFADWNIDDRAEAAFGNAPGQDILEHMDEMYRRSGEQFGLERETPYLVFESLLAYLAENGRLDEAAELSLRHSDRYPLPLVPNVIAGIARRFVDDGDPEAAIDYLSAVLDLYPGNETARQALMDLGFDPEPD